MDAPHAAIAGKAAIKGVLIEKAELLFGVYGIEGTSLRKIATAAGSSNSYVVQYHFENKSGLVRAILEDRLGKMEARRNASFEALTPAERQDPRALLTIFWDACLSFRSPKGAHTYCKFMQYYNSQARTVPHPAFGYIGEDNSQNNEIKTRASDLYPYTIRIIQLIGQLMPSVPPHLHAQRMQYAALMFFAAVAEHDHIEMLRNVDRIADFGLAPVLDFVLAALPASASAANR